MTKKVTRTNKNRTSKYQQSFNNLVFFFAQNLFTRPFKQRVSNPPLSLGPWSTATLYPLIVMLLITVNVTKIVVTDREKCF